METNSNLFLFEIERIGCKKERIEIFLLNSVIIKIIDDKIFSILQKRDQKY